MVKLIIWVAAEPRAFKLEPGTILCQGLFPTTTCTSPGKSDLAKLPGTPSHPKARAEKSMLPSEMARISPGTHKEHTKQSHGAVRIADRRVAIV